MKRYRRRDLRNSLESRLGMQHREKKIQTSKKRLRIENISLDTSDYDIEDLVKDFSEPIYFKIFDTKEERKCILEFTKLSKMEEFVSNYNHYELNGQNIKVEIFEQNRKYKNQSFYNRNSSNYGSHYNAKSPKHSHKDRNGTKESSTLEELDAQLDAYMNS